MLTAPSLAPILLLITYIGVLLAMTPTEKLLRLREIHMALEGLPYPHPGRAALYQERVTILATVAVPPVHLECEEDPGKWATEFRKLYPAVDEDLASIWFNCAILAGKTEAPEKSTCRMEEVLRLVLQGLEGGQIRAAVAIKHNARPDLPPVPLAQAIRSALGEPVA